MFHRKGISEYRTDTRATMAAPGTDAMFYTMAFRARGRGRDAAADRIR
jgi:hypothetical protein